MISTNAKVVVERHDMDGSITRTPMRFIDWLETCKVTDLTAGMLKKQGINFYAIYMRQRNRRTGAKRWNLVYVYCDPQFVVTVSDDIMCLEPAN